MWLGQSSYIIIIFCFSPTTICYRKLSLPWLNSFLYEKCSSKESSNSAVEKRSVESVSVWLQQFVGIDLYQPFSPWLALEGDWQAECWKVRMYFYLFFLWQTVASVLEVYQQRCFSCILSLLKLSLLTGFRWFFFFYYLAWLPFDNFWWPSRKNKQSLPISFWVVFKRIILKCWRPFAKVKAPIYIL